VPGVDPSRSIVPDEVFVNTSPAVELKVPPVRPVIVADGSLSFEQ
jgi:hypothetical protein